MERSLAEYLAQAPVFVRAMGGDIIYWTVGCEALYGYTLGEVLGRSSHELFQTVFPEPLEAIDETLRATGEWSGQLRHTRKSGDHIWTQSLWRLREGDDGAVGVVVEQNTDVTNQVLAERRQAVLTHELNHRMKNTLAVVQGLFRMTFPERDARLEIFEDRLVALSHAHAILMRQNWEAAPLSEVLSDVLGKLHVGDRISLKGPDAPLTPNAVVTYALAFHELATNAIKHGALSRPGGRIAVTWERFQDAEGVDRIHLVWRETGGPPVAAPSREGFGSRLLRRVVAAELGTPVRLEWRPDGLVCEFDGPLQKDTSLKRPED